MLLEGLELSPKFRNHILHHPVVIVFLNFGTFQTRNMLIREMVDRYKTSKTFDDFMATLYPIPKTAQTTTAAAPGGWVTGK